MICGLEIGMLIAGIIALVKGKMSLTKTKVVTGPAVYIVGSVFILPLPLAMMAGFAVGFCLSPGELILTIKGFFSVCLKPV